MKSMYILVLLLGISCSCSKNNNQSSSAVNKIGYVFTVSEQKAVEEVKKDIKSLLLPSVSRTDNKLAMSPFQKMSDLDEFELSFLPYYAFDLEKFYSDPSPEMLRNSIESNPLFKWILARKDGIIDFKILIENKNSKWIFKRYAENWEKAVHWLKDSLSGVTEYKLFLCDRLEFFEFKKAGKYYYYTSLGKPFSEEQLCEYFVDMMNQKLENKEL